MSKQRARRPSTATDSQGARQQSSLERLQQVEPQQPQPVEQAPQPGVSRDPFSSPWVWVRLFLAAGLVGLVGILPKYVQRQAQRDLRSEAIAGSAETGAGQGQWADATLALIMVVLAGLSLVVLGWLWWRQTGSQESDPPH